MNSLSTKKRLTTLIFGAVCALSFPAGITAANASTFSFVFDNAGLDPMGTATPPYVGSGILAFAGDLAPGSYDASMLSGLAMSFSFDDGESYTLADAVTPLSEVLIVLTGSPGSQQLQFSNSNMVGFGSGDFGGSLDFVNQDGSGLSFEPPGNEGLEPGAPGLHLYFELGGDFPAGNYLATQTVSSVPLPASLPMFGAALLGLGAIGWTMKRKTVSGAV